MGLKNRSLKKKKRCAQVLASAHFTFHTFMGGHSYAVLKFVHIFFNGLQRILLIAARKCVVLFPLFVCHLFSCPPMFCSGLVRVSRFSKWKKEGRERDTHLQCVCVCRGLLIQFRWCLPRQWIPQLRPHFRLLYDGGGSYWLSPFYFIFIYIFFSFLCPHLYYPMLWKCREILIDCLSEIWFNHLTLFFCSLVFYPDEIITSQIFKGVFFSFSL